jgi:hypothetical protein
MRETSFAETTRRDRSSRKRTPVAATDRCRRKFLRYFPGGFTDPTYIDWERGYKWSAHLRWQATLGRTQFRSLLEEGQYREIAARAITVESRTNLLFSFEKMALRDAVREEIPARQFAGALFAFLYADGTRESRFEEWRDALAELPVRQTRVLTWPLLTVFGFIARPDRHIFLKPTVTRLAAERYGFAFTYRSAPSWETYASMLAFGKQVLTDQRDLGPRDMIDAQSFIWVQGSDEYPGR